MEKILLVVLFSFILTQVYGLNSGFIRQVHVKGNEDTEQVRSSENGSSNDTFPVVCYLAIGEKFSGPYPPETNVTLCTHIILLVTVINGSEVTPAHDYDRETYFKSVATMKKMNPKLKVLLSNGGDFGSVLISQQNRKKFAASMLPYLTQYDFDGFDLDWEFPYFSQGQKHNFSLVLQTIRETFDNYTSKNNLTKYLLSAAVIGVPIFLDFTYEVSEMAKYVDFINVMTYDIHGFNVYTPFTGFNSPLYSGKGFLDTTIFKTFNLADAAKAYLDRGMPAEKIFLGIPAYGHTYELLTKDVHGVYSLALGVNKTLGDEIGYATVCGLAKNPAVTVVWDNDSQVPYMYHDKLWVSYDNETSVALKAKWIKANGFGGVMTFSLSNDDFMGTCDGIRWPIHLAIHNALKEN